MQKWDVQARSSEFIKNAIGSRCVIVDRRHIFLAAAAAHLFTFLMCAFLQWKTSQDFSSSIVAANLLRWKRSELKSKIRNSTQFHAEELFIRSHCSTFPASTTRSFAACVHFSFAFLSCPPLYLHSLLHRATFSPLQIRPHSSLIPPTLIVPCHHLHKPTNGIVYLQTFTIAKQGRGAEPRNEKVESELTGRRKWKSTETNAHEKTWRKSFFCLISTTHRRARSLSAFFPFFCLFRRNNLWFLDA